MQTEGGRPPPGLSVKSAPPDGGGKQQRRPRSTSNGKKNIPNTQTKEKTDTRRYEPKASSEDKLVLGPPQKSFPSSQRQYNSVKNPPGYSNGHNSNNPSSYRRSGPPDGQRRPPTSRGSRPDSVPGRHIPPGPGSRSYPSGNPRPSQRGGPPRDDRKRQPGVVWSSKAPPNEPSTSPTSSLSLLPDMTSDLLVDSPISAGQESNFIDSLFAGIGLDDDDDEPPSKTIPPISAAPPQPEPPIEKSAKTETIEEWTARKEKESRAIGSWFTMGDDEPLESTRSVYRPSRTFESPADSSKFSFGRKPEFLERRQEAKMSSRQPPGFTSSEEGGDSYRPRRTPPPGFANNSPAPASPMSWFKGESESWDRPKPRTERDRDREWDRDRRRRAYDEDTFSYDKPTTTSTPTPAPPPGFSRPIAPPPGLEGFGKKEQENGPTDTQKESGEGEKSSSVTPHVQEQVSDAVSSIPGESNHTINEEITAKQDSDELKEAAKQETVATLEETNKVAIEAQKDEEKEKTAEDKVDTYPATETTAEPVPTQEKITEDLPSQPSAPVEEKQPQPEEPATPSKAVDDDSVTKEKSPKKVNQQEASIRSKRKSLKNYLPNKGGSTPSPTKNVPLFPLMPALPLSPLSPMGPLGPAPGMPGAPLLFPVPFAMPEPMQLPQQQKPQQHFNPQNPHNSKQNKLPEMPNLPFLFPTPAGPPFGMPPSGPMLPPGAMFPPNLFPMGPTAPYNHPMHQKPFGGNNNSSHHSNNQHSAGPISNEQLHNHHHHSNNNINDDSNDNPLNRWFPSPSASTRGPGPKNPPGKGGDIYNM